jgi:hypothetical protein
MIGDLPHCQTRHWGGDRDASNISEQTQPEPTRPANRTFARDRFCSSSPLPWCMNDIPLLHHVGGRRLAVIGQRREGRNDAALAGHQ